MAKLPTADDVKKARKQAADAVTDALEQARTPLYAVLGAGDLATEAVREYVTKARGEAGGQAKDVQARLTELQDRLVEVRAQVRTKVGELPDDVAELRGKFEPAELRTALEGYVKSLQDVYEKLAARGETTADKLRRQPRVQQAMDRVEDVAETAEERVGRLVEDAREIADDVLGRVTRRTRSVGEKAAIATEKAATEVSETVSEAIEDAGDEVARTTRSVSRKVANRTSPAKPATRRTTARKTDTKA